MQGKEPHGDKDAKAEHATPPTKADKPTRDEKPRRQPIESPSNPKPDEHDHERENGMTIHERVSLFSSIAIAMATSAYVIVTWYQWKAISQANALATRAVELENRPWISIENLYLTPTTSPEVPPTITLSLVNAGKTPAMGSLRICTLTMPVPPDAAPAWDDTRASPPIDMLMPPQRSAGYPPIALSPEAADEWKAVQSGQRRLWILVRITYTDMFKTKERHFWASGRVELAPNGMWQSVNVSNSLNSFD